MVWNLQEFGIVVDLEFRFVDGVTGVDEVCEGAGVCGH